MSAQYRHGEEQQARRSDAQREPERQVPTPGAVVLDQAAERRSGRGRRPRGTPQPRSSRWSVGGPPRRRPTRRTRGTPGRARTRRPRQPRQRARPQPPVAEPTPTGQRQQVGQAGVDPAGQRQRDDEEHGAGQGEAERSRGRVHRRRAAWRCARPRGRPRSSTRSLSQPEQRLSDQHGAPAPGRPRAAARPDSRGRHGEAGGGQQGLAWMGGAHQQNRRQPGDARRPHVRCRLRPGHGPQYPAIGAIAGRVAVRRAAPVGAPSGSAQRTRTSDLSSPETAV